MFTLYVGDKKIGNVVSVEADVEPKDRSREFNRLSSPQSVSLKLNDVDPEFKEAVEKILNPHKHISMSIEGRELQSKVLGKYFKKFSMGEATYHKISKGLSRLERLK